MLGGYLVVLLLGWSLEFIYIHILPYKPIVYLPDNIGNNNVILSIMLQGLILFTSICVKMLILMKQQDHGLDGTRFIILIADVLLFMVLMDL
jgi:hypothetical protein